MAFKHGVYTYEVPTSLLPARNVDSNVVFAVGCAAVTKLDDGKPVYVNKPRRYDSYADYVEEMGWDSNNFSKFSLQELVYSHFALYRGAPMVVVNVFDPEKHVTHVDREDHVFEDDEFTLDNEAVSNVVVNGTVIRDVTHSTTGETFDLEDGKGKLVNPRIVSATLVEHYPAGETPLDVDLDYTLDDKTGTITRIAEGTITSDDTILHVSYDYDYVTSTVNNVSGEIVTLAFGAGTLANPGSGIVTAQVVDLSGGTANLLVEGTDYTIDYTTGLITIINGTLPSSGTVSVTYDYNINYTTTTTVSDEMVTMTGGVAKTANPYIRNLVVTEPYPAGIHNLAEDVDYTLDKETGDVERISSGIIMSDNANIEAAYDFLVATPFDFAYTEGADYELDSFNGIVTRLSTGGIPNDATLHVEYDFADVSLVTSDDIIGSIDANGESMGLEIIDSVFPLFRLVPGSILCPKYCEDPAVTIVMAAKSHNINGLFQAIAIADIPSDANNGVSKYTEVAAYKQNNNLFDEHLIVCWPKVKLGDNIYGLATHLTGLMSQTDYANGGVPYESASNKNLNITSIGQVDADGSWKELALGMDKVNSLNGEGIFSALNWDGGLRSWGGRMSVYPTNTDPKDCQEPIRRMFNWWQNTFILTYFQKVDAPIRRRLIQTILRSEQIRLEGHVSREMLLGGRIEFDETENPLTDLIDGIIRFHVYFTPPPAARAIEGYFEFDVDNLNVLFG